MMAVRMAAMKRRWLIVILLSGAVLLIGPTCGLVSRIGFERELRQVGSAADTLIIDFNPRPPGKGADAIYSEMPSVRIDGHERITEFMNLLRFKDKIQDGSLH